MYYILDNILKWYSPNRCQYVICGVTFKNKLDSMPSLYEQNNGIIQHVLSTTGKPFTSAIFNPVQTLPQNHVAGNVS